MNGIDNLTLYKTVDELQESKNSIERRTGIDFSKNVQQFDLLLDIIGEETPETEEKRQVEVVEQILEAVWPKNLFEAYCSDKDNIVQAVYSNMIAIVLFSLKYLLADEIIEDEYDSKLQWWLDMKSGEEEETFECYERMKRTVSNKIKKIAKNVRKSKDDYEQNLRLPIQLPQSTHKKKILKSLMKKIVELEANSAQENGADGKSDSKQKKRTNSISWNILKLAEKEENVANFKKINANEKRSIKKIYETLCREITEVSMRKVEDTDKAEKVMLELAYENVNQAFGQLLQFSDKIDEQIYKREDTVNYLDKVISEYISTALATPNLNVNISQALSSYYLMLVDIERISDYAVNMNHQATKRLQGDMTISEIEIVEHMKKLCVDMKNDLSDVEEAERKDDVIDSLVSSWREAQIQALKQQKCSSEVSMMLSRIFTDFERINDHALNVSQEFDKINIEIPE